MLLAVLIAKKRRPASPPIERPIWVLLISQVDQNAGDKKTRYGRKEINSSPAQEQKVKGVCVLGEVTRDDSEDRNGAKPV